MAIRRRSGGLFPVAFAAAIVAGFFIGPAAAQEYPSRPVRIIVPFGAGGPSDVYSRAIAAELQKSLHQPFVTENRPGAGTTIGTRRRPMVTRCCWCPERKPSTRRFMTKSPTG